MIRDQRLRWMLILHLFWIAIVLVLGIWWSKLLLNQARELVELKMGLSAFQNNLDHWEKVKTMLFWELGAFITLLIGCSALILWIYSRDLNRTQALQAFFASVTHELKTPLTSMRLQAEGLEDGWDPNLVRRLLEDLDRLQSQIERSLELARLEKNIQLRTQPLLLSEWLPRSLNLWTESLQNKITFDLSLEAIKNKPILADQHALAVIIRNLIENAVKHSGKKEVKIWIEASTQMTKNKELVCLRFYDNGSGLKEMSFQLGELFSKDKFSTGSGIGLYLIKTLMKKMGGKALFNTPTHKKEPPSGFSVSLWFKPDSVIHA